MPINRFLFVCPNVHSTGPRSHLFGYNIYGSLRNLIAKRKGCISTQTDICFNWFSVTTAVLSSSLNLLTRSSVWHISTDPMLFSTETFSSFRWFWLANLSFYCSQQARSIWTSCNKMHAVALDLYRQLKVWSIEKSWCTFFSPYKEVLFLRGK